MARQQTMPKPEKACPMCNKVLEWVIIRTEGGAINYNGYCFKCHICLKNRELPDHTKGRKLAPSLVKFHALDKQITKYNTDVQVGILRARHFCTTCQFPVYGIKPVSCICTDCTCLYCTYYKLTS